MMGKKIKKIERRMTYNLKKKGKMTKIKKDRMKIGVLRSQKNRKINKEKLKILKKLHRMISNKMKMKMMII